MMNSVETSRVKKSLHTLALANAGIWVIATIALIVYLETGGNIKGMFVILAGGTAVAIQIIASMTKLR
jgi:hypothetical protein